MNVPFYVYRPDDPSGKILRTGTCPRGVLKLQARPGEVVKEGRADDSVHKVVGHELGKKTPEEIAAANPPAVPPGKRRATITQDDLAALLNRLAALESKGGPHA